jgi:hypothetical protein
MDLGGGDFVQMWAWKRVQPEEQGLSPLFPSVSHWSLMTFSPAFSHLFTVALVNLLSLDRSLCSPVQACIRTRFPLALRCVCCVFGSILKMEAVLSFETSISFYQTAPCHIPLVGTDYNHYQRNFKSNILNTVAKLFCSILVLLDIRHSFALITILVFPSQQRY